MVGSHRFSHFNTVIGLMNYVILDQLLFWCSVFWQLFIKRRWRWCFFV